MPTIKPYELQTQAAATPATRITNDVTTEGKAVEQFGKAIGGIGEAMAKREQQEDLSDLNVQFSEAHADLTNSYNQQLHDGTLDTELFSDEVQDRMDKIGENVKTSDGQRYYDQTAAAYKSNFLIQSVQGSAVLAGEKAKGDYLKAVSNNSNALINNPSNFEFTNEQQLNSIDNMISSGALPADKAEELKQHSTNELAKSAVRGWINLDPAEAEKQLNSGKWDSYLADRDGGGDTKKQMLGEAKQAINGQRIEDERIKKQEEQAIKDAQLVTQNDFLDKMEAGTLSTKDILHSNLDAFGSGSKEQFLRLMEQNEDNKSKKIKMDPATFTNLFDRIHLPDGDPNKITDENDLNKYVGVGRGLDITGLNQLRAEMQGKKTQSGKDEASLKKGFTDIAKGQLTRSNPLTGIRDPEGDAQYQKFLSSFMDDYAKQRQEGKSPEQLLNPDSPDYMGKSISQYTRSQSAVLKSMVQANARSAPTINQNPQPAVAPTPRKIKESPADYLKRIGK